MLLRIALPALLCAAPGFAFEPYLVKDINPLYQSLGSQPSRFIALGNIAFFLATTGEEGIEPWASDGTAAGTFLLADVCSGICPSHPRVLMATPKGYFFSASNRDGERELWVSGGTPASTIRLATRLGTSWEVPPLYLESQGILYFIGFTSGDGGIRVAQLWRSDGTPAGTHAVADLHHGSPTFGRLVLFRGRIFFSTSEGDGTGPSLWVSDGTAAGTRLVKRAWPENGLTPLAGMVPTSRFLYFFAPSPKGVDLWRSDGTSKGTRMVADLNLVTRSSEPLLHSFAAFGDRLLFAGEADDKGDEVWVSDGTAAGTRKITNFSNPTPFGRFGAFPFIPLGNRLVFEANDGTKGNEIWGTDGTAKGTRLLVDVFPGPGSGVYFLAFELFKGRIVFRGTDGRRGQELWTTDGTPKGTRMIRDICRGSCDSSPYSLLPLNGGLLFIADSPRGREFWKTDGTAAGTVPVTGSFPTDASFNRIALPGKILFSRWDDIHGEELWATDGTAAGTGLLADLNDANQAGSGPGSFLRLGNTLLFAAYDGQRSGLWKSDGTAEGTVFVHDLDSSSSEPRAGLNIPESAEAGGTLLLSVSRGTNSIPSLWRTDGTAAGTVRLDLGPLPKSLRVLDDKIFFVSHDENFSRDELWVSDGTAAGTRQITGLVPEGVKTPGSDPGELTIYQGQIFFTADAPLFGRELWKTDGTEAGTVLVRDFEPKLDASRLHPALLTVHQNLLYFSATDDEHGRELWSSDGTAVGTRRVTDIGPGFESFRIGAMTSAGSLLFLWNAEASGQSGLWVSDGTEAGTRWISPVGRSRLSEPPVLLNGALYFFSRDGADEALWRSDGTSAGTYPVLDAVSSTHLEPLTTAGGLLFFKNSGALWRSDGTAAGTFKVRDQVDYPTFSVGPRLFFPAYDPATGTELWAIDTRED